MAVHDRHNNIIIKIINIIKIVLFMTNIIKSSILRVTKIKTSQSPTYLELREVVPKAGIHRRAEGSKLKESLLLHLGGNAGCYTFPR